MRDLAIVWREYRNGNHITDGELTVLLHHIDNTAMCINAFKEPYYRLVLNDLWSERGRLALYKTAREEK